VVPFSKRSSGGSRGPIEGSYDPRRRLLQGDSDGVLDELRPGASSVKRRAMHSDSGPRQYYRRQHRRRRLQGKLQNSQTGVRATARGALQG
jgi:hypothetical protein